MNEGLTRRAVITAAVAGTAVAALRPKPAAAAVSAPPDRHPSAALTRHAYSRVVANGRPVTLDGQPVVAPASTSCDDRCPISS